MKRFEEVELVRVPTYKGTNSKLHRLLTAFDQSGLQRKLVTEVSYKTPQSGKSAISTAIRKLGFTHIYCNNIGTNLYLIRSEK